MALSNHSHEMISLILLFSSWNRIERENSICAAAASIKVALLVPTGAKMVKNVTFYTYAMVYRLTVREVEHTSRQRDAEGSRSTNKDKELSV